MSGKSHFDNYYYRVNADFYRVNKPVRQIFLNMRTFHNVKKKKTVALGKNWVQNKIVLYPNLCYIDACYNEVDLYLRYIGPSKQLRRKSECTYEQSDFDLCCLPCFQH